MLNKDLLRKLSISVEDIVIQQKSVLRDIEVFPIQLADASCLNDLRLELKLSMVKMVWLSDRLGELLK